MKNWNVILMAGLLIGNCCIAAENKKVIDIGELEVEGEVRRPPVDWIDSSQRMKQEMSNVYIRQFQKLENELLKPVTRTEAKVALRGQRQ